MILSEFGNSIWMNQLFVMKLIKPVEQFSNGIAGGLCVFSMYYDVCIQECSHFHVLQEASWLRLLHLSN